MPSWASRSPPLGSGHGHGHGRRDGHGPPVVTDFSSSHPERAPPPYPSLIGVPTLSPQAARQSPGAGNLHRRASGHNRSVSHPFPSFFGGGSGGGSSSKREDRRGEQIYDEAGFILDNVEEDEVTMPISRSTSRKTSHPEEGGDFVTGSCATCDSTVRWPRHLDVYRCTVCQMVNDLKVGGTGRENGESRAAPAKDSAGRPLHKVPRKAPVLSLDQTRQIIDQCISTYLQEVTSTRLKPHGQIQRRPVPGSARSNSNSNIGNDGRKPSHPAYGHYRSPTNDPDISKLRLDGDHHIDFNPAQRSRQDSIPGETEDAKHQGGKYVFRQLENYLVACMTDCDSLNAAFMSSLRPPNAGRTTSESALPPDRTQRVEQQPIPDDEAVFEVDAKTLLLGDIGENGLWWTGDRRPSQNRKRKESEPAAISTERRTLRMDLHAIYQWYDAVLTCGRNWRNLRRQLPPESRTPLETPEEDRQLEERFAESRYHVQRTLLKTIENLLRRPGRPLREPDQCRFLLIFLLNPLLYPQISRPPQRSPSEPHEPPPARDQPRSGRHRQPSISFREKDPSSRGAATGHHSGLIKRIVGLLSNAPSESHQVIASWMCRLTEAHFRDMADLVNGFVAYRLSRQHRGRSDSQDPTLGLVPDMTGYGAGTSAHLHAALGVHRKASNKESSKDKVVVYGNDWQLRAAAKVMSLLFSANSHPKFPKHEYPRYVTDQTPTALRARAHRHAQLLPTSAFYNTLLDTTDLVADFETWESRSSKFCFCQYPMFLSIWAKIRIMEHDARRQMETRARDAFFTSIISRKAVNQYLILKVRRDCLVDDSLRGVSEVVGTGQEEIKKGLRIEFLGEEGVDAGGLRKEWFLLLVREVFDPDHGLFVYDEESNYCYFNPNSFETSDQFFLVGVVLGLAIYNSTILDVALPPFAFRKLLSSAPNYTGPTTTATRPSASHSLEDLAEWKPSLAKGLRQLLDFDGDVQEAFARDFVIDVERYGQVTSVPLCPNGANRPVTNANRREFVDLYIRYLLDSAVSRQYEPFKRGFFTVTGGNALTLFRPEEIELLIRGSDEALDVAALRAVASYEYWPTSEWGAVSDVQNAPQPEPEIARWFWEAFAAAEPKAQRQLLTFITGSDRIPAMGPASLVIRIALLTADPRRYPIARTCFNQLGLHRYRDRMELERKLWSAVEESEGFGLK